MAGHKSKADDRLRKLKLHHQQQIDLLKREFGDQLQQLTQTLQPMLYGQCFYHEAMMNLLTGEDDPDSAILIGAVVTQRWLQESGEQVLLQVRECQRWVGG